MADKSNAPGKDVVILHTFQRSKVVPSMSPFTLKLETYLRAAGIKYEFDASSPRGPKNKAPWITLNGEDCADSELIIDMLNKKFNIDMNSHLTEEQKAVSRFIEVTANEHMTWGINYWMVIDPNYSLFELMDLPTESRDQIKDDAKQQLHAQGLGRHSPEEVVGMMEKNFHALSNYLGNKPFLMGDKPSQADFSAFGFLAQFIWAMPDSPDEVIIRKKYHSLVDYCERMKQKYYPDWDQLLTK